MTRDDIIRMARETGLLTEYNYREIINFGSMVAAAERNRTWTQDHWTEYERSIAAAEREKVARWQIGSGYTTGHGETIEDLLVELEWQVRESERNGMVATASELGWALYGGDPFEDGVRDVAAIRARREQ